MRLDDYRESSNVESQRGMRGLGGGGGGGGPLGLLIGIVASKFGIGGVIVVALGAMLFGVNPLTLLGGVPQSAPREVVGQPVDTATNATDRFVSQVLATTEDTWGRIFAANGQQYPAPSLVFYSGNGQSGCGAAQAAMGPFYCPSDQKIYLDTGFFDEMAQRFGAPGDFAVAYVIAHEVGHHIQQVTGTLESARRLQTNGGEREANAVQVRVELQADCYAGVWGAANRQYLDAGDVAEAMRAAEAIGDDALQRAAGGQVVPDSFTHGTSEQRMRWFKRGFDSGDPAQCDTFAARTV
jgi:uncharacterized protein